MDLWIWERGTSRGVVNITIRYEAIQNQNNKKTHQKPPFHMRGTDEEKTTFCDFTFLAFLFVLSLTFIIIVDFILFFCLLRLEPLTSSFIFLRWPDCPDDGTSTTPLSRWTKSA